MPEKQKFKGIMLTGITEHIQKPRKPHPWHRQILRGLRNKGVGKITLIGYKQSDGSIAIPLEQIPPEVEKQIIEFASNGKTLSISTPQKGIPAKNGIDVLEHEEGKIRRMRKNRIKQREKRTALDNYNN